MVTKVFMTPFRAMTHPKKLGSRPIARLPFLIMTPQMQYFSGSLNKFDEKRLTSLPYRNESHFFRAWTVPQCQLHNHKVGRQWVSEAAEA